MKLGILGIVFGVLLLLVGLTFSGLIIDQVNKQGGKISCFDGSDILIKPAQGPKTSSVPAIPASKATADPAVNGDPVPTKVSSAYQGGNVVGKTCGTTVVVAAASPASTARDAVAAFSNPACSTDGNCGTIRYTLEVFGADSLNNLMTLAFWIVLIMIAIGLIGAGGYAVRGAIGV